MNKCRLSAYVSTAKRLQDVILLILGLSLTILTHPVEGTLAPSEAC